MTGLGRRALVLALAAGCGARQPARPAVDPVRAEIERAEDAEKLRHHDEASVHYKAAIAAATTPKAQAWAHHEFAETLATWGQLADALHELEAAAAATPADPCLWRRIPRSCHTLGSAGVAAAAASSSWSASASWPHVASVSANS